MRIAAGDYRLRIVMILVAFVREIVLSRATLRLENIALRQQVAVLKRERRQPAQSDLVDIVHTLKGVVCIKG